MKRYSGLHDKLCTIENIEGRGIHLCANNLKRDLRKYPNETIYCLKLDIRKFYPSIPHVKSLNMIGVFMLKIEKKKLNLKHNIL